MNKIELIGRLVKDIEVKKSKNGNDFGTFTLAVQRKSNKEITDFFDCVVFGNLIEVLQKYTSKGLRLLVEGELQINTFEDKEGNKKQSNSVVVNDFYFVDFNQNVNE